MDAIELPIRPTFDPSAFDKAIARLKELEAKGFTIPVNFVSNLETLKADAEALIARLRGQWLGLSSDLSSGNNKLLQELDRLGESTAAARLKRGFASVREEVLVLDNLISQLNFRGDPGAGLAKGLAAGRIADLVKSGQAAGDTVSFAGYGEQAEKATTAQVKFTEAEIAGARASEQSQTALAAQQQTLRTKATAFEEARVAARKFQDAEVEQAAQTRKTGIAAQEAAKSEAALIRSRFENGKLASQTFGRGPGTTEQVSGTDTTRTVDRLKMAKAASEALNFEMQTMIGTQKAQGASATVLNQTYASFANKLDEVALKYRDLERAGQTNIGRQATLARSLGGNVLAQEQARLQAQQKSADEALQRQRSQALIRQAKEDERKMNSGGFKGVLNTVGTAGTFIATYGAIDLAVRALKAGAEASVEFERKLATLSVIFRGTKGEATELAKETLNVAAAFGQDGIAALEVATDFARFGGTQAEVLEAVRVVSMAANVAQIDLAESSKYFQAIMAGGALNAGQLAGVLGSLNTISNTYNVTVKQLLEGLARVAPLAKQAGIGLTELSGFEAVISGRTSRPGAEAGNALKSLISRLAKPEIQGTLQEAGVNVKDQTGELKSASQIINELYVAYQKLGSAEREELLIKVAGTQQASRIAALLDGYITSQELSVRASRDLTSADRENVAVRETLSSQLGTLRTRWEQFWVAGSGAGSAGGVQGAITDIVKLMSNLLQVMTLTEKVLGGVAGAAGKALKATLGETVGGGISESFHRTVNPVYGLNKSFEDAKKGAQDLGLGDLFKSEAEKASEALVKFNGEVEKLQKLGEADAAAGRLIKTIAGLANTAPTEKLESMFRAVAAVSAAPGDLRGQESIRAELNGLVKSGDYLKLNARLTELAGVAEADRVKQLGRANAMLGEEIAKQTQLLAAKQKERDIASGKNDQGGADQLNKQIDQIETGLAALRGRQSGNFQQQFAEGEDPWKAAAVDLAEAKKNATELVKIMMERPKTTHLADLDKEADAARLLAELEARKINAAVASGALSAANAKDAISEIEKEKTATLELIDARRKYALILDTQAAGQRSIDNTVGAFGEVIKAVPTLNRSDELAGDLQLIDIKDQLLQLEKARELPMLRALGLSEQEISVAMGNIDAQRNLLKIDRERVAEQERFAAAVEAAKRGSREAQATNEAFGIGKNESERKASLIRGLTNPTAARDQLTGLPLNVAAAQSDFAGAANQIEQARALSRLKEFGISLQNAENDLVRRRYQLEAEITNERRKQAEEASKNLLMADRETQLRAALAAKFAAERGGKGFSANEFLFLDQGTKQAIEKTNPELLPPEFKNRLRELTDESAGLTAAFNPLKESADAAAKALAALQLPSDLGPKGLNVLQGGDFSQVGAAIDQSGHAVQTAIEVLANSVTGHFNSFAGALEEMTSGLDARMTRLERGSSTARIGSAQGAASVLA